MDEHPTRRFFIDILCFLLLQIPYVYMFIEPKPYPSGFFCNDQNLMYPLKEDTVSMAAMSVISIAIVYVVILLTDIILSVSRSSRSEFLRDYELCCCRIHPGVWVCFKDIATFMVGASLLQNSSQATKIMVGRLRPNFFEVCKPNFSELNCDKFVENFTCTSGADEGVLYNAMSSFPSSHASFTSFCTVYVLFFLQAKMTWKGSSFLRITIQSGALAFSLYSTVTRLSDNVHFLSDIVAGLALGISLSALTAFWVSDMFEKPLSDEFTRFATMPPSSASFQKDYGSNTYGSASSETRFGKV